MAYTYDDFVKAANQSGLMGQFSQDDLNLAQKYPEFGLSVLSLKKDYNNAATAEQRLLANQAANELRKSYGNYSGGADGGSFRLESKLNRRADDLLGQIGSFGSFSYDEAPTYENAFAQQQKDLLDRILNREDFSWSKETDPQWSSYKKSYLREGDRATANALAQASAASGGRPSSYAVNAATQAGDYYATKLNDVIPTLYQQAYERYLDEYNMKLKDLNTVNQQEQLDYAKYLDRLGQFNTDRGFAYQNYADDYDRLRSQLADVQGQDQIDYARYLDEVSRQQTAQDSIRSQVDAILAAGGSPSANLVSRKRIQQRVRQGSGGRLPQAGGREGRKEERKRRRGHHESDDRKGNGKRGPVHRHGAQYAAQGGLHGRLHRAGVRLHRLRDRPRQAGLRRGRGHLHLERQALQLAGGAGGGPRQSEPHGCRKGYHLKETQSERLQHHVLTR